jgi:hypothetical protein
MSTTTVDRPLATEVAEQAPRKAAPIPGRQPMIGIAGLVWVLALFFLLGVVPTPLISLYVLGPLTIFMLPTFVVVAIWWQGRPAADTVGQPAAGAANTLLIAIGAILSTWLAQAIVAHGDLVGVFRSPLAAHGHFTAFPYTVPIAAATIVAMLQLTLVNERWPFERLGGLRAGVAAFVGCWAIGLAVYLLVANWDAVPAAARHALGLRNPGGPMDAIHLVAWLLCVALWQNIYFTVLEGRPFSAIRARGPRLLVANVGVIATAWAWYLVQKDVFDWPVTRIAGVVGVGVAACFLVAMLFERWPFQRATGAAGAFAGLAATAAVTVALFFGLRAFGNAIATWGTNPVELWVGVCGLNYIAAGVILHYGIFGRWPYEPPTS